MSPSVGSLVLSPSHPLPPSSVAPPPLALAKRSLTSSPHRIDISEVTHSPEHSDRSQSDVKIWRDEAGPTPVPPEAHDAHAQLPSSWSANQEVRLHLHPSPAPDFFSAMPPDCLYSVLLLLDGPSLATLSAISPFLTAVARGTDVHSVWRDLAATDVTRLSLQERQAFDARDLQPMSGELTQAEKPHGSPRALYLLRIKQRALTRAGGDAEATRVKQVQIDVLEYKRHQLTLELALEAAGMIGVPSCLLLTAILLLSSASIPQAASVVIFVPIWLAAIILLMAVYLLVRLQRRQEEHEQRELSLRRSAASPSSSSSKPASSRGRGPRSPSSTFRAHQKQQRDRLNARFITRTAAPAVARGGPLQTLSDALFDEPRTTTVTLAKASLMTAASILLCVRTAGGVDGLPYYGCFMPLFLLFGWSFLQPLVADWSTSAGSGASPYLAYARHVLLWRFPLLASLVLLTIHLDASLRLSHAFIPIWIWQGVLLLVLVAIALQFAIGIRIEHQSLPTDRGSFALLKASCFPYRFKRDGSVRNLRLSVTVATLLGSLIGIILFEVFLCLRADELRTVGHASSWPMAIVAVPLVFAACLVLLISAASAWQMGRQRRAQLEADAAGR